MEQPQSHCQQQQPHQQHSQPQQQQHQQQQRPRSSQGGRPEWLAQDDAHVVHTIFVDELPRIQFVSLAPGGAQPHAKRDSGAVWGGADVRGADAALANLQLATREWLKFGSAAQATMPEDALLNQLYYLHTSQAALHVIAHITPELNDADEACAALNHAARFVAEQR
jgi:hypothetical protein